MFTGLADPAVWAALAFILFIGVLFYYQIPAKIAGALDDRAEEIQKELDAARHMREEAQAILADYQRKERDAEKEAEDIVTLARKEAESLAEETRTALKEQLERRTQMAEEKIARAEAQAVNEVRAAAAETAIAAAEKLIKSNMDESISDKLIRQTIDDLKTKLN